MLGTRESAWVQSLGGHRQSDGRILWDLEVDYSCLILYLLTVGDLLEAEKNS